MSPRQARLRSEEKGSVAILVALMLTGLIGLTALGTDVGRLYVERQRLSVVADAAALSGAQYLPNNRDLAAETARAYLTKNGIDPNQAVVTVAGDNRHVDIQLNKVVPMTFARVIGSDQVPVAGNATSWTANLSGYYGAAPLGVPRSNWQVGDQVYLKMGANSGTISPGNYQALALGKSGASMYEQNLMYGYKDWIRADQWVETEPGNMAGPTVRAVNYRISQDPHSTFTAFNRQSPRLVVVPILENFNVNGRGEVHVIGFGVFYLESGVDHGSDKGEIIGRFVKLVMEGEGSMQAPDLGAYTTKLIN